MKRGVSDAVWSAGKRVDRETLPVWGRQEPFKPFPQLLRRSLCQEPHHDDQQDQQGSSIRDEGASGQFVIDHGGFTCGEVARAAVLRDSGE